MTSASFSEPVAPNLASSFSLTLRANNGKPVTGACAAMFGVDGQLLERLFHGLGLLYDTLYRHPAVMTTPQPKTFDTLCLQHLACDKRVNISNFFEFNTSAATNG